MPEIESYKVTPWGDKILAEFPIFKGQHGFFARAFEKQNGEKYIEISKYGPKPAGPGDYYRQTLRLFQKKHWVELKFIIESKLSKLVGWRVDLVEIVNPEVPEKLKAELEKLKGVKRKKTAQIERLQQTIENLMKDVDVFRKQHIQDKLPEFRNSLKEYKKLIKEDKEEKVYQKFFEENAWLLGLEYTKAKPQKKAGAKDIPDFLMERFDGFNDIIELKRPGSKVFISKNGKQKQSGELKNAISEVMDYIDYYAEQYSYEMVKYKENVYKPKAIIIIGSNLTEDEKQKLRQHNSYLHRIEVVTYDDISDKSEAVIKFYEKIQ